MNSEPPPVAYPLSKSMSFGKLKTDIFSFFDKRSRFLSGKIATFCRGMALSCPYNVLLVLVWLAIGIGLRLIHLASKSPWTDEFSTLVFSLGNSFRTVPLDQAIALHTLLQPLQPNPAVGVKEVTQYLIEESNHPPVYFVLAHWWMQLFPADGVSLLWKARSLSALLGTISIPAMYGLGWLAFQSRLVGHLAAAMMAVSPYGIFLAQEARHYTLAILFVIASLACLIVAVRHLQQGTQLPIWVGLIWVAINTLGIATHYFFALTLCAEAIVLSVLWWHQSWQRGKLTLTPNPSPWMGEGRLAEGIRGRGELKLRLSLAAWLKTKYWGRFYAVVAGTIIGGLVWLPTLHQDYDSELTQWIKESDRMGWEWLAPIFQAIAAWITMISLLPVEASALSVIIVSVTIMVAFFLWALPILKRGLQVQMQSPDNRTAIQIFGGFVAGAIALFFLIAYGLGIDLTRGARYNFVYFPAVILLVAASLAVSWNQDLGTKNERIRVLKTAKTPRTPRIPRGCISPGNISFLPLSAGGEGGGGRGSSWCNFFKSSGKKAVALIWIMGLVSGLTVVCNLGYQKYYRPDLLVPIIQQNSQVPVLIATTHRTHVQTGELMGIAWEFKRLSNLDATTSPIFILAHQEQDTKTSTAALQRTLETLPKPLDLWLVNFHAPVNLEAQHCSTDSQAMPSVDGYEYQLYHCFQSSDRLSSSRLEF